MKTTEAYSSHSTNWPVVVSTVVLALPLAGASRPAGAPPIGAGWVASLLALVIVVAVGVLTATSLRVTIGQGGVTARFGALTLPRFRYPIESITSAGPATIRPWATPGIFWTHREGLRLALRGGPAVRLTLRSGRRVTVGVDDSSQALQALQRAGASDVDT